MNHKNIGFISLSTVRFAYRGHQIFHSPLLEPVDKIEDRLREFSYLKENEHLLDYDCVNEGFNIVVYRDGDKPFSLMEKIKHKIRSFILG